MDHASTIRLLKIATYELYVSCLCSQAPARREIAERMRNPKAGDLVVEVTTLLRDLDDLCNIGRLVKVEQVERENPTLKRDVWTIELVFKDGVQITWENCE